MLVVSLNVSFDAKYLILSLLRAETQYQYSVHNHKPLRVCLLHREPQNQKPPFYLISINRSRLVNLFFVFFYICLWWQWMN